MARGMAFLMGVALGAAFGSSLALLFAPHSGEETRHDLGERAGVLRGRARELADDARERVRAATARFRKSGDAETA